MIVGYIRVSTDKQSLEHQKSEILAYAQKKQIVVNNFIEIEISSRKTLKDRQIDKLFNLLKKNDTLIVSELSRIGRSTREVLEIIESFIAKDISIHFIKQNLIIDSHNKDDMTSKVMITMFSLFSELERDLISSRTREALSAKKAQGMILGKKSGTLQKSKYDKDIDKIIELSNLGLNLRQIQQKHLKYGTYQTLRQYFKKRFITKDDKVAMNDAFEIFYNNNIKDK